jgi:hypothetical protein
MNIKPYLYEEELATLRLLGYSQWSMSAPRGNEPVDVFQFQQVRSKVIIDCHYHRPWDHVCATHLTITIKPTHDGDRPKVAIVYLSRPKYAFGEMRTGELENRTSLDSGLPVRIIDASVPGIDAEDAARYVAEVLAAWRRDFHPQPVPNHDYSKDSPPEDLISTRA